MSEHDDVDRKIRALFDRAGRDAPDAMEIQAAVPRPAFRRWPAVAAALVLVGGILVIARHDSGRSTSAPGTDATTASAPQTTNSETNLTTIPSAVTSAAPSSSTTVPTTGDCAAVAPPNYDAIGTIHTIVPNTDPVDVTIVPDTDRWCAGGKGSVVVFFQNRGQDSVTLDRPTLILNGGIAKWEIGELRASLTLAPDEQVSIRAAVVAPPAPPGSYTLAIYGFLNSHVPITIDGAVECTGSTLRVATSSVGSINSNLKTTVTVTNNTSSPCLLSTPLNASGEAAGVQSPIQFTKSTYFGDPPALPSRVLQPGSSAMLWIDTGVTGVCGTPSPRWTSLFLTIAFDYGGAAQPIEVTASGAPFDTGCGLGVSAWGTPG
jgi:hypothetical protein